MSLARAFMWSMAAGAAMVGALVLSETIGKSGTNSAEPVKGAVFPLLDSVSVREQIAISDLPAIKAQGFRTLIDLRPDGEAEGQPDSASVSAAAKSAGLAFAYHPTPHGDIPDQIPADLSSTLANAERPVLLYCRSGKRAARVWALAEASRVGGPDAAAISNAVRNAGQPLDDLLPAINARITSRAAQKACEGGATSC